jgi:tetraacyldisaccharide 4'-kinase
LIIKKIILFTFSILYGSVLWLRNKFFDWGFLNQKSHPVKVISVGNISMGGTGKTPQVEYIVRLLQDNYKVAILSRGYGRKTKGFLLANDQSNAMDIGDEPLQYFKKFENIPICVCENRNKGVEQLLKIYPLLEVVILDDAYQHRYIKRDINILLTDFHRPFHKDLVIPAGRLREFRSACKRADIITVTKTPVVVSPITRRRLNDEMKITNHQKLLFSKINYEGFVNLKSGTFEKIKPKFATIVLFSGIANSYPLQDYLRNFCTELVVLNFSDHHYYREKDLEQITKTYNDQFTSNKILITTEKDVQRLVTSKNYFKLLEYPIYYVPIRISFHGKDEDILKKAINKIFS